MITSSQFLDRGEQMIVGVDEVGRGCLAGPLVACAVILENRINGLKDSKLLDRPTREHLTEQIVKKATAIGIGWVHSKYIDEFGLTKATILAMETAINQLNQPYKEIIIDGNYNFLSNFNNSHAIIKADNKFKQVSAASIVAKVSRDSYMRHISSKYPHYGFEHHVGYGTKHHISMIKKFGVSNIHRSSWKPFIELG